MLFTEPSDSEDELQTFYSIRGELIDALKKLITDFVIERYKLGDRNRVEKEFDRISNQLNSYLYKDMQTALLRHFYLTLGESLKVK